MRTLRALVDVILPATDSPAASAAGHSLLHRSRHSRLRDARRRRRPFAPGLQLIRGLASVAPAEQVAQLKARAAADMALPYDQSFFKILKDYTLTGYFLSEIGATQALAYEAVPGGFQGDLPLAPDQKAWAI